MTEVRVVPLDPALHNRPGFSCGESSLDAYLRARAGQDMRAKANAVFVMTPTDEPSKIAGYYTLCGVGIDPGVVPEIAKRRLPRYPQVSATLLGSFAVAIPFQGYGLGAVLLFDALARAFQSASQVGSTMIVTDPIDERAASFYVKHGFRKLAGAQRMFLMMQTIAPLMREKNRRSRRSRWPPMITSSGSARSERVSGALML